MLECTGRVVSFGENPYDLSDRGGPSGISRTLVVATGSGIESLKLTDDCFAEMLPDHRAILHGDPFGVVVQLGVNVTVRTNDGVSKLDQRAVWCKLYPDEKH